MKFRAGENVYTVIPVDITDSSDPTDIGYCIKSKRLIQIIRNQSFDSAIDTLVHEYLHAAEWNGADFAASTNEERIRALAGAAIAFLRQYNQQGGDAAFAELLNIEIDPELRPSKSRAEVILSELTSESPQIRHAAVVRWVLCSGLSDAQFEEYRAKYEAANLNPLLEDCYAKLVRKPGSREITVQLGTTIKALRRIADRSGRLSHPGNYEWAGPDGVWKGLWTGPDQPYAARCKIKLKDETEPVEGIAHWSAFAQYVDLPDGSQVLGEFWERMGYHMLAKCAEANALQRAFAPCNGLYIAEEMQFIPQRKKFVASTAVAEGFGDLESQLSAARAKRDDARPDDTAEAAPSLSGFMNRLHDAMRRAGATVASVRDSIIAAVRSKAGMLEDENPEAFAAAVMTETRMVLSRR